MLPKQFHSLALLILIFVPSGFPQVSIQNAKFDVLSSRTAGSGTLTSSPFDLGTIDAIFDGKSDSLARTPNINPAFVQVTYSQARTVSKFRVYLSYGDSYQWSVEKADSQSDLDSKTGTWASLTPAISMPQSTWSEFTLPAPATAKIFKLNVRRFGGDGYCHINEWEIYGDVVINKLNVTPTNNLVLYAGDVRQFTALGTNTIVHETYNVAAAASWNSTGAIGIISTNGSFTATNPGSGTVYASIGSLRSSDVQITVLEPNNKPDIDVLYIERTPRLSFNPSDTTYSTGLPAPGQTVTYLAHVKNWGTETVNVPYEWWFDDALVASGATNIDPGLEVKIPYPWNWDTNNHTLEFRADPQSTLREAARLNNRRKIRSNALLVGLWVEKSLYDYFHNKQLALNDGANSFEDWGQRMIDRWNYLFSKAVFPVAPQGFLDRVALDRVVIVPDNALPLAGGIAGNNPDSRDRTVDMQWGYPWDPKSIENGQFYMFRWNGPFYIDYGSIHEMNHARYHIDLYALDENHNASAQNVLIYNDSNQLLPGSSYMPFIAFDVVYYNKYRDIMGAGSPFFDAYSTGAWNWKAHKRGQGNQNSPPDIGRFMNDLPATNIFQFIDQNGVPLAGAEVWFYNAVGGTYTKQFDNSAEGSFIANAAGQVELPRNPFGAALGGFGPGSPIFLFKVRYRGQQYYFFQEVTDFNIHYWMGETQSALYTREIDLRDNPSVLPAGGFVGNYFNGPLHTGTFVTNRNDSSIDFAWSGAPLDNANPENFSVYWNGRIKFPDGFKKFTISSDGGVQIHIDGRLVFDQRANASLQTWTPIIFTASSSPFVNPGQSTQNGDYHRVEIRYTHASGPARISVSWADEPPPADVPVNLWRADYYNTKTLQGYILSRLEERIDNDYASGSPDPMVFSDNFSARWTGDWDFKAGTYTFKAITDDGMRIYVDDALALDKWFDQPPATYTFSRTFVEPGRHRIRIEYYEGAVTARAFFGWSSPPTISDQPQSQTAAPGDNVTFTVVANGEPEPAFQWYFNKQIIPEATSNSLLLTNVQSTNAGSYYVTLTNSAGNIASKPATLTILEVVPRFTSLTLNAQNQIELALQYDPALQWNLETSTNLTTWQILESLTNSSGALQYSASAADARRFFRIKTAGANN